MRILRGQAPYRDFFVLTGPGAFWLTALMLHVFGVSLQSARLLVVADLAVFTTCTYWLTARLAGRNAGIATAVLFFAFTTADANALTVNHRWDAGAMEYAAIVLLFGLLNDPSAGKAAAAGLCAAASAWITPPMMLPGLALAVWLACNKGQRRHLAPYLAGCSLVTFAAGGALALQGALAPMIQHMLWTASNYGGANRMAYGAVRGGYSALFAGAATAELAARGMVVFVLALPAVLPVLAGGGWAVRLAFTWRRNQKWRDPVILLLVAGFSWLATAYPRGEINHLAFVTAVFFVLGGALMQQLPSANVRLCLFAFFAFFGAMFLWNDGSRIHRDAAIGTPVGQLQGTREDQALIMDVLAKIHSGESLFVFPYAPILYFMTQTQNPTQYAWLQPGMMVESDERAALKDLNAHPPQYVIYNDVPAEAYLRIWPNSNPASLRMNQIEEFIHANYWTESIDSHPGADVQIMKRATFPAPLAAQSPRSIPEP